MATSKDNEVSPDEVFTGKILRHPVTDPAGRVSYQLILIVTEPDEAGAVRGVPLAYEHETAQFQPHQFAAEQSGG